MRPETASVIRDFHAVYSGGLAEERRKSGEPNAMPPWAETRWLGRQISKCPMDLWVLQEIVWETRPELIVECGTGGGGSAFFMASILDLAGGTGEVITVDTQSYPHLHRPDPRIRYLTGDSIDPKLVNFVRVAALGKRTMVVLDSHHTYEHVRAELDAYGGLVSPGCYLVVEDTGMSGAGDGLPADGNGQWCDRAVAEFLAANPGYVTDRSREKHLLTSNGGGWIQRER
jgi:cephalosporin hydroxylase